MNAHSLENCIAVLQRIRDVYSSQLDTSVVEELGDVIASLKMAHGRSRSIEVFRALSLMGTVIHLVSNLKDLMK